MGADTQVCTLYIVQLVSTFLKVPSLQTLQLSSEANFVWLASRPEALFLPEILRKRERRSLKALLAGEDITVDHWQKQTKFKICLGGAGSHTNIPDKLMIQTQLK